MKAPKNVLMVGVGGQGILLVSEIFSKALAIEGFDVKVSEVHGMAQRGGSVHSMIRYGEKIYSPVIMEGEADEILAFEMLEALRWLPYLSEEGRLIVNDQRIDPLPVAIGKQDYPSGILEKLKGVSSRLISVDSLVLAKEAGNVRTANLVLLGILVRDLRIAREIFNEVIRRRVPAKTVEMNLKAFKLGLEYSS